MRKCAEQAQVLKLVGMHCLPKGEINELDVYNKQKEFRVDKNENERRKFVAAAISFAGVGKDCKMQIGFPEWKTLCKPCWRTYNGVESNLFQRIGRGVQSGRKHFERHRKYSVPAMRKAAGSHCFHWLQSYARTHGDHMPDCMQIHLPDYRWRDVWKKYRRETESLVDFHYVSEQVFRKLRLENLPYVKIRKVKRFATCPRCSNLRELIDKASGAERGQLKMELEDHIEWQFRERDNYYKHRFKARTYPHKYLTMSVDGMDNGKTAIPRLHRENKDSDELERLGTHLTGVLMHGRRVPVHAYTWYDRFPTGSDSIVTIVCHALCETAKEGPLPPVLYLHLDNCGRENKNRYVLALNHLLVEKGVFVKVKMSFLPVGHTHDDVDQFFSRINSVLTRRNIMTIQDLHAAVKESFLPTPTCTHLDNMGMFVPWFLPLIEKNISGHSQPRCFLFKRSVEDKVGHFYRQNMQTRKLEFPECWFPANKVSGHSLFKDFAAVDVNKVFQVPYKPINLPSLRITVESLKNVMNEEEEAWWEKLLGDFDEQEQNACDDCIAMRQQLKAFVSNKTDTKDVANEKSRGVKRVVRELQEHVLSEDYQHVKYENWFPPSHALPAAVGEEAVGEERDMNEKCSDAIRISAELREEGLVNHHVGPAAKRDVWDKLPVWEVKEGHIGVFSTHREDQPWIVGLIKKVFPEVVDDEGKPKQMMSVHEMGYEASRGRNDGPVVLGDFQPARDWKFDGKNFFRYQVAVKDRGLCDEYFHKQQSNTNYIYVRSMQNRDALAFWGPAEVVLRKSSQLFDRVLQQLQENPNVKWKYPPEVKKRKPKKKTQRA